MRLVFAAAAAVTFACGGRVPSTAPAGDEAVKSPAGRPDKDRKDDKGGKGGRAGKGNKGDNKKKDDPLFPTRESGWKKTDAKTRAAARALGGDYLRFIGRAATPRRAIAALVDAARAEGAVAVKPGDAIAAGGFYASVAPGGRAAWFARPGTRPVTDGLQIVVVSVDAPRLFLKQRPIAESHGFAMLETHVHGSVDLASWMVYPLALHVYVDRGGKAPTDVVLGGKPGEPVLSIPDVLPHLSGSVQGPRKPLDAERLDAIGARTRGALVAALRKRGVSEADLAAAEADLVPASAPVYVGADRGLVGGYGQRHRAFAYAAVRGLATASAGRAAVVIAIDNADGEGDGTSGRDYVRRALADVISRLAAGADSYDVQRSLSRSSAMVAIPSDKGRNKGVRVNVRSSDSLPAVIAAASRAFDEAGVQFEIDSAPEETPSRELGTLDIDTIDVSIAVTGARTPGEVLSILDLYQGVVACRAWLSL